LKRYLPDGTQIGADIVNKQEALGWGSGVIVQLSQDLRFEFPGESGFSETNLRYMKRFYELYSNSSTKLVLESPADEIQHQVGAELALSCMAFFKAAPPYRDKEAPRLSTPLRTVSGALAHAMRLRVTPLDLYQARP
jgi:hypothetical protein